MTGADDFIPFVLSRLFAGLFAAVPAILGSGYVIDLFYLHQRGKAFAIFEVLVILAVIGGATLSGFIAQTNPWNFVFWWTLGHIGGAMICVLLFVEDTSFDRSAGATYRRQSLPRSWFANRVATFLPGTRTQPPGKLRAMVSQRNAVTLSC
jgi:MFS family permease